MAMEVIQTINGAHEDALAGIAYNPINKQVYTCAEGDKAIKVSSQHRPCVPCLATQPIACCPPGQHQSTALCNY
jgi:hypothetical protein